MIIELILVGSAASHWKNNKHKNKGGQNSEVAKCVAKKLTPKKIIGDLLKNIKGSSFSKEQCQSSSDKEQSNDVSIIEKNALLISIANLTTALIGNIYPSFSVIAIFGMLYVSKDFFAIAVKDIKNKRYISVFIIDSILFFGIIFTGHLVVASFSSMLGNIFVKVIKKTEDNANKQLVNVFGDHPEKVWLKSNGIEIQVDFESIQSGDTIVVGAGEVIPVDGNVIEGLATVDQHILTGESQPVEKIAGDKVFAATLVLAGRIDILVETAGQDTVAAKIGEILNNTRQYKDQLIARGQEITESLIPLQLGIFTITLLLLGQTSALTFLWTGLGSTMMVFGPITVLNYLRIFSRNGILIKDGRVLESLRQVDTIIFDKTGTLTLDQPEVRRIHKLSDWDENAVLCYAAAAEYRQSHPVAKAILERAAALDVQLPDLNNAQYDVGYGIQVTVDNKLIRVGSARFMLREGIQLPEQVKNIQVLAEVEGFSLIYVGIDGQLAGILEMHPCIRPEATDVIQRLKQLGMQLFIISGDHEHPTRKMAEKIGIDHYFSEVMPEQKAGYVKMLTDKGRFVCFIGDGINDSIALKSSHVSISIHGASTAAINTAQIIFMDGTLKRMSQLFSISDEFEKTMKRNFYLSILPGAICIGGVYIFNIGLVAGMGLFYAGAAAGIFNTFFPVLKHKDNLMSNQVLHNRMQLHEK